MILRAVVHAHGKGKMFGNLVYNARFWNKDHVKEYVSVIVSLIGDARARPFYSREEVVARYADGDLPAANSTNDIKVMYTIGFDDDRVWHHLSFSSQHNLATRNARSLAALFCRISGLDLPDVLLVSNHGVYHAEWILDRYAHDARQSYINPKVDDPEWLSLMSLLDSTKIEMMPTDVPVGVGVLNGLQ